MRDFNISGYHFTLVIYLETPLKQYPENFLLGGMIFEFVQQDLPHET
jgi:hypothetical protein